MQNFPPVRWALRHPRIAAWAVLSLGMVILLVIEARDVGLQPGNWVALITATVLVAGMCIWIVSWEDVDETEPAAETATTGETSRSEAAPPDDTANARSSDEPQDEKQPE